MTGPDSPRRDPATLDGLEREVRTLVRRVRRAVVERATTVHENLQPAGYLLLAGMVETGPARLTVLAEQVQLDKGATSRLAQHLVDLGLVERTPDPDDGRACLLAASDLARHRMAAVAEARRARLERQLTGWSEHDLTGFVEALRRYNQTLEDEGASSAPTS